MEQNNSGQVVYVKDMVFAALYRWKIIILMAVIFALLLGAFQYVRSYDAKFEETEKTRQIQIADLEKRLDSVQRRIESQRAYIKDSPLINMDPYPVYKGKLDLTVVLEGITVEEDVQSINKTGTILRAYQNTLLTSAAADDLAQILDVDVKYLMEALRFSVSDGSGVLSLAVFHNDPDAAQKAQEAIQTWLTDAKDDVESVTYPHSVHILPHSVIAVNHEDALDAQKNATSALAEFVSEEESVERQLESLKLEGQTNSIKDVLVFAIIGAILGGVLTVVIVAVAHIFRAKVYSARTLQDATDVPVLCCLPGEKKTDKLTAWFRKLEQRSATLDGTAVAVATVRLQYTDLQEVLLLGQCPEAIRTAVGQAFQKEGIRAVFADGDIQSVSALTLLREYENVILIETCGKSRYDRVQAQKELLHRQSRQLIGCILLNG